MSISSNILRQTSYPGIITAMENNLVEFIMYCSCIPGAQAYHSSDHIAAITGIPQPSLNVVMRTQMDEQTILARIQEVMTPFKVRQVPMLWWIFPGTRPANLGQYLKKSGLQYNGSEPGMALELSHLPAALPQIEGFSIEEVESAAALEEWIHVSAIAFGGAAASIDPEYVRFEQCLGWGKDLPSRRFLGRLDGKAVATSSIFLGAGIAGLFSVGTLPEVRGRGIGTAISMAPLSVARALGYNIGVLQASPAGYSVYSRIGFRECCQIQTYLWSPQ
ncbi:GNAT family N-acetyltransferase [Dictyobacter kobayashii]|uniref:N-acetyltransferase domain-containing protein n=1 Tax=Dictyobacter kobayashii TaxID=2014872 RepID=A0A402AUN5_9CHLR|nr:GNAT family N-acetyltransferase [Dictyobacter kobayashii]GCE22846.1 hypothetical protein KDK_66460 [Dictyobacter kobayashii]